MMNFIEGFDSQALLDILMLSKDTTAIYSNSELEIRLANQAMLKLWGKGEEVIGMRFEDALPEMEGQPFTQLLKDAWHTGQTYEAKDTPADLEIDGKLQTYYFDFIYRPIRNKEGKVFCLLHTATEVSDRIAAWKAVAEKEKKEQELNEQLAASNEEYQATNEELEALNEEYQATNEELERMNLRYGELNAALEQSRAVLERSNIQLDQSNVVLKAENLALTISEQKILDIFQDAPVAIGILTGTEMNISSANIHLLRLWGRTDTAIGQPLADAIPELQGQAFLGLLDKVYHSGIPYYGTGEQVYLERNGQMEECYFNYVYKPLLNELGEVHSIMIVANEVTSQILDRMALEDNSERLNIALMAGKLGSYDLNLDTGKMETSLQCKLNFGLQADDKLDMEELFAAILPKHREQVNQKIQQAIQHKTFYSAEYQISCPDGSTRWIHANGLPRYDQHGKALRMLGVTQDITLKKEADQRRDDFLSIASHELKTPITSLKGNIQLLDKIKASLASPMAETLIVSAKRGVDKLTSMVEDLLNINRYTEGKLSLKKNHFRPWQLFEHCCGQVRTDDRYELVLEGDSELMVHADEQRIDQVINNFVENAVKYAPKSEKIYLKVQRVDAQARISVRDTGPGIPQDQLPHLFERYWRADSSSRDYSGLGLGLFICAEIVRNHGGQIGADSELGEGTEFWLTLPLEN